MLIDMIAELYVFRQENPSFDNSKWGDEEEYYNDHPGACPPSPPIPEVPPVPEYKSPTNVPVSAQ